MLPVIGIFLIVCGVSLPVYMLVYGNKKKIEEKNYKS